MATHCEWRLQHWDRTLELNRMSYNRTKDGLSIRRKIKRKHKQQKYYEWWQNYRPRAYELKKQYYQRDRSKAINLLGNNCDICKDKNKLEFHHLYYALDSRSSNKLIFYEVLKHPERFQLLCSTCHKLVTFIQKDDKGIEKSRLVLERLINSVRDGRC